ncbi:MAG: hypothetical protein RMA76_15510 [Deltaproteobacteria bacterium]|jgi:hypothetical protein
MRKVLYAAVALSLVACADEEKKEEVGVAANEAVAEPEAPGADVAELKEDLAKIVGAVRDRDVAGRRATCLKAVPKIEAMQVKTPDDKALTAVATDLLPMCVEMTETKKLLDKLANPPPSIQLTGAYAQFTRGDLVKTYKKAKRAAKRKQDPAPLCSEIRVLTDHFGSKKSKKTRRLVKKASKFCDGYAHLASARYHMRVVDKALQEGAMDALVSSCVHGVKELAHAPAGKLHDALEAKAQSQCVEAVAMQGMLRSDAT